MTPQPPRSTLFPYTTLFRSDENHLVLQPEVAVAIEVAVHGKGRAGTALVQPAAEQLGVGQQVGHARQRGKPVDEPAGMEDRKSTRLNSSHSQISYAVFCLKK